MSHLLHNVYSPEPIGSTVYHYGYKCEVKSDGEVWADVPKGLLEIELSAGRIRAPKAKPTPIVEAPTQPEPVVEIPEQPEETLEQLQEPSAIVVKVDGRTRASKKFK